MNKKIITLSLLTATMLSFSGCGLSEPSPVKNISFEQSSSLSSKTIKNFKFDIKKGQSLESIVANIEKKLRINIMVDDKINSKINLPRAYFDITLIDYLKIVKKVSKSKKEYTLNQADINNTYFMGLTDTADYTKQIEKEKKEQEKLIRYLKKTNIEFSGGTNINEIISVLIEDLNFSINLNMKKSEVMKIASDTLINDFRGSVYDLIKYIERSRELFISIDKDKVTEKIRLDINNTKSIILNLTVPPLQFANTSNLLGNATIQNKDGVASLVNKNQDSITTVSVDSKATTANTNNGGNFDIYKNLEESIIPFISDKSKFSIQKSTKKLTFNGSKQDFTFIEDKVNQFNAMYKNRIKIEIKFYTVETTDNNAYGIDLQTLTSNLLSISGKNIPLSFTTNTANSAVGSENAFGSFSFGSESNKFAVDYLNKYGLVEQTQSPILFSLNSVPATLNIVKTKDYVKSIKEEAGFGGASAGLNTGLSDASFGSLNTQTNAGLGNTFNQAGLITKNVEVENVEYGFKITVTPNIEEGSDYINVVVKPEFTNLDAMTDYTYETGNPSADGTMPTNIIKLLDQSKLNMGENGTLIRVKNGMSTIIGGYKTTEILSDKNGFSDKENSYMDFLGKKSSKKVTRELIIVLTATKMEN